MNFFTKKGLFSYFFVLMKDPEIKQFLEDKEEQICHCNRKKLYFHSIELMTFDTYHWLYNEMLRGTNSLDEADINDIENEGILLDSIEMNINESKYDE